MRVQWLQTGTREMSPPFTSMRSTVLCVQLWPALRLLNQTWFLLTPLDPLENFRFPAATCSTCSNAPQPLISLVSTKLRFNCLEKVSILTLTQILTFFAYSWERGSLHKDGRSVAPVHSLQPEQVGYLLLLGTLRNGLDGLFDDFEAKG